MSLSIQVQPISPILIWGERVKMDFNKRSFPEQKTIKTLKYNPQGFKITIN